MQFLFFACFVLLPHDWLFQSLLCIMYSALLSIGFLIFIFSAFVYERAMCLLAKKNFQIEVILAIRI